MFRKESEEVRNQSCRVTFFTPKSTRLSVSEAALGMLSRIMYFFTFFFFFIQTRLPRCNKRVYEEILIGIVT